MKRLLHHLTVSLALISLVSTAADETSVEDQVTFSNPGIGDTSGEEGRSTSPFFAGLLFNEVPAGYSNGEEGSYQSVTGFNFGYQATPNDRFTSLYSNVSVTEFQTLVNVGASTILYENSKAMISGRALGGYAFGRDELDDTWHTSFDLFAASQLGASGSNFVKLGAFVDVQDDFGKWGPALGLLLAADSRHPITIDAAYGVGFGDPYQSGQYVYSVADDDFQIQAGIALNPNLEVGVTGQYLKWDGVYSEEQDWKTGGFVRYHAPKGFSVSLGAAGGEHGATGFLHFTLRPKSDAGLMVGSGAKSSAKAPISTGGNDHSYARSWMATPIHRQETLQIRQENVPQAPPTEPPMGSLVCTVDSGSSLGPLFAGVDALHRVTYTNTGTLDQAVTINSIQNFDGTFFSPGTTATLAPGQQLTAQGPDTMVAGPGPHNLSVVITVNGQQFNSTCTFNGGIAIPTTLPPITIGP